jgi:hypothetical protein
VSAVKTSLASFLLIALAGCGSKGGSGADGSADNGADSGATGGCHAQIASDGEVRWDDDGVHRCAEVVAADRSIGSDLDFIEILASVINGPGVLISVSVTPPPPLGGTYTCDGDAGARTTFMYSTSTKENAPPTSCTVTFTNTGAPGVHATGTFSATVSPPTGGSKSITNGFFDVPLFFPGD